LWRVQERQRLQEAVGEAVGRLGERERFIVRRRLLADDELSLVEMGKHLGVSRERVRQLEVRAKRQLRAGLALAEVP
jgi:RNA polymerase sigma-32 factor